MRIDSGSDKVAPWVVLSLEMVLMLVLGSSKQSLWIKVAKRCKINLDSHQPRRLNKLKLGTNGHLHSMVRLESTKP